MTPDETGALLSYAATLDPWLRATDEESAELMRVGWASILGEVPLDFAQQTTRAHYSAPDARTLQPGDVSGAWRARQRHQASYSEQVERTRELTVGEAMQTGLGIPGAGAYLRAMFDTALAGGDPAAVPRPAGVRVLTREADERSRRCRWHALPCTCDHTVCRDGWLDTERVAHGANGRRYLTVERCPACHDALLMAEERGLTKKPAHAGRRR